MSMDVRFVFFVYVSNVLSFITKCMLRSTGKPVRLLGSTQHPNFSFYSRTTYYAEKSKYPKRQIRLFVSQQMINVLEKIYSFPDVS